jgi:hypothetical protein
MNLLSLLFAISYSSVSPTTFYANYYTPKDTDHSVIYDGNLQATFDPNNLDLFINGTLTPRLNNTDYPPEFQQTLYLTEHQQYYSLENTDQPFLDLQLTDGQNTVMNQPNIWPSIYTNFAPDFSSITLVCIADSFYKGAILELGNSVYLKEVPAPEFGSLLLLSYGLAASRARRRLICSAK